MVILLLFIVQLFYSDRFTLAAVIVVLSIVIGSFWSIGNAITPEKFSTSIHPEKDASRLKQMSYLKFDESSESVNIIQELNIDCKDLGIVLNIPSGEIQSIWKSSGIIRNKCRDTLEYWLKGGELSYWVYVELSIMILLTELNSKCYS